METVDRCCLTFIAFLCVFKVCEPHTCKSVVAKRNQMLVPEGGSTHMSCDVVHCGVSWTGGWVYKDFNSTTVTQIFPSSRIKLSNESMTVNRTRLTVHIQIINQSDAGSYKCEILWPQLHFSSSGHLTYINVTPAGVHWSTAEGSERKLSLRLLVCFGAFMCFPIVLCVVWCLSQDRPSAPPVPPHPRTSITERVKTNKEVVYAEVALNDRRPQKPSPKQVLQPTIYSSLHFK
ncbi:uncharacterized protein [Misgurnus anguillicaudatus]|uniref:uncharacterized protein isoform X1 n=1 Tax=Misgurnus anguillicaudatus TaxID=75329 RepID=UPI003CCF852B